MTFADRIAAVLAVPGWTQARLAEHLKVTQSTVSRWITKGVEPGHRTERRLAELERTLGPQKEGNQPLGETPYDNAFLLEVLGAAFEAVGIDAEDAGRLAAGVLGVARQGRGVGDPHKMLNRLFFEVLIKH